ncbi:MAG: calcium-binding protein, partial [Gemmatimonas sp.]
FIPKPNGWELGKRDPSYPGGQRFLASGHLETFPIGKVYDVTIVQDNDMLAVFVDGLEIVRTRDAEKPYTKGRIGIYAEDAAIKVHSVRAL